MTNDELRRRLVQGLPLCPHEHTAHTDDVALDEQRYWLTCGDEVLGEVILGRAEEPAGFFERWGRQHQYEVAREHLKRLLDPPPNRHEMADRIAVLEAAVEEQGNRLTTAEQRLQGNLAL